MPKRMISIELKASYHVMKYKKRVSYSLLGN